MGLRDFLFGKPRLDTLRRKRGLGKFATASDRLGEMAGSSLSTTAILQGRSPAESLDGEQLRKYGKYIAGGFNEITSVGAAELTDLLGSTFDLYYVKEGTFDDYRSEALWLVNNVNRYMVEPVMFKDRNGVIEALGRNLRFGNDRVLDVRRLHGQPWSRAAIREAGIDIP